MIVFRILVLVEGDADGCACWDHHRRRSGASKRARGPGPRAVLIEFGESAVKLELQIFVEFGFGAKTKDEVQMAIEEAFEKHGINFAQPRLSLNLERRPSK